MLSPHLSISFSNEAPAEAPLRTRKEEETGLSRDSELKAYEKRACRGVPPLLVLVRCSEHNLDALGIKVPIVPLEQ